VVLAAWDPEFIPDRNGCPVSPTTCGALALALVAPQAGFNGIRLRIIPSISQVSHIDKISQRPPSVADVQRSIAHFSMDVSSIAPVAWHLQGGGSLEFRRVEQGTHVELGFGICHRASKENGAGTEIRR